MANQNATTKPEAQAELSSSGLLAGRLGMAIRILRKSKGMTLDALAGKSGISKGSLSRIETGDDNMTVASLCAIAGALGTEPGFLINAAS